MGWLEISKEQIELTSEELTVREVVVVGGGGGGGTMSEVGLVGVEKLGLGIDENGEEMRKGVRVLKRFEERARAPCLVLEIISRIWLNL